MSYFFDTKPKINMPQKALHPVVSELLSNYTFGTNWEIIKNDAECEISFGNFEKKELDGFEYVINVTDGGVFIGGRDYSATMRGFVTFLEKIKYDETQNLFYAESECIKQSPKIGIRCAHLCFFPEKDINFFKKCVRACAAAKYTHIIFEFWGMLKFDCMKELSWPFAHTKAEIKEIVAEANAMGVEIIPMFNHLGHASACRELHGKHVVLDQNPKLENMFESYGWIWNISRSDVKELLKSVRAELAELCGEGKYFHLGCDEAYAYGHSTQKAKQMCDFLNEVSKELAQLGRRPIIWHDMLLSSDEYKKYVALSNQQVSDMLLDGLDKNFVIADWQYDVKGETWKSSQRLKKEGFDVWCCPWDNEQNIIEAQKTVVAHKLSGFVQTTWNTLNTGFRELIFSGVVAYGAKESEYNDIKKFFCANLARKVMPSKGDYQKCGWSPLSTGAGL